MGVLLIMGDKFNIVEVTKIAADMEISGQKFYERAAELTKDEKAKGIFLLLAEQEKGHFKLFNKLHELMSEIHGIDDEYLYDENVSAYLKALMGNKVFKDNMLEDAQNINSIEEAINIGITSEKNSILFYSELMKNSTSREVLSTLEIILQEEKKHLVDLTNLLNTLKTI